MADLNFSSVLIGTSQPEVLTEFYSKVVDRAPDMNEGGFSGWKIGSAFLTIGPHSEVKGSASEPQRILLNLETPDVKGEFDRISGAGARVVQEPYELQGATIATLADPDGELLPAHEPVRGAATDIRLGRLRPQPSGVELSQTSPTLSA
jgi:predicted enzyme related to lactoylglutathione lyase